MYVNKMELANEYLQALVMYLYKRHNLDRKFVRTVIVHNVDQDRLNRNDPRAFCFVQPDKPRVIQAAQALHCLPEGFLLGVLYHELGHLVTGAFGTAHDEPKVDLWCTEFAPELKYTYSSVSYRPPWGGERVVAMNLQRINSRALDDFANFRDDKHG